MFHKLSKVLNILKKFTLAGDISWRNCTNAICLKLKDAKSMEHLRKIFIEEKIYKK